jgi:hypothetical protein
MRYEIIILFMSFNKIPGLGGSSELEDTVGGGEGIEVFHVTVLHPVVTSDSPF